jgi:drug/metabolite transporter, DME family
MSPPTVAQGRICILIAAILWSLSGAFTKVLTMPTFVGVNLPAIEPWLVGGKALPIQIACYRAFFAGLVLMPTLRRRDIQFRPMMFVMVACFALMNATFISAQALGTAANAILLQNSAPLWLYLVSIFWLGEAPDRRGTISLFVGLLGIAIIIGGGWQEGELAVVGIGLLSGLTYAGVILSLRVLRDLSSGWLTVWNHLLGALVLAPLVLMLQPPSWQQFVVLFLFGAVQLGLPYWLMARGLRSVSAPEAGALTLIEPILTPVWTWLIAGEVPQEFTYVGGAVIVAALAYRYWPARRVNERSPSASG